MRLFTKVLTMKHLTTLSLLLLIGAFTACGDDNSSDKMNADDSAGEDDSAAGGGGGDDTPSMMVDDTPDMMVDDTPDMMMDDTPEMPVLRGATNPPKLGAQIDRMGRSAISTATISTFETDEAKKSAAKDKYNAAAPAAWPDFEPAMAQSLAILDALDGMCGNQLLASETDGYVALAGILADDRLYVNSASGKCGTYLGLEGEIVGALEPGQGGCGGRTPTDDVIERSYSLLAAGVLVGVDDTISSDGSDHDPNKFPFLAAPNK